MPNTQMYQSAWFPDNTRDLAQLAGNIGLNCLIQAHPTVPSTFIFKSQSWNTQSRTNSTRGGFFWDYSPNISDGFSFDGMSLTIVWNNERYSLPTLDNCKSLRNFLNFIEFIRFLNNQSHTLFYPPQRLNKGEKAKLINAFKLMVIEHPYELSTIFLVNKWRKRLGILIKDLETWSNIAWVSFNGHTLAPCYATSSTYGRINKVVDSILLDFNRWVAACNTPPPPVGLTPNEILNYSTKVESIIPLPKYTKSDQEKLLGVELELEWSDLRNPKSATAQKLVIKHLEGHVIMKRDGSVNGMEIVTIPALISTHQKKLQPFMEDPEVKDVLVPRANCGIHIHLARKGLSFLQQAKIIAFLNNPANVEYVKSIAGRDVTQVHYCKVNPNTTMEFAGSKFNQGESQFGDRYSALNLHNNNTVEFRIFKSTLDYQEFAGMLEFVEAMRQFTIPGATCLPAKETIKLENFINWINSNKKHFPNLYKRSI